MFRVIAAIVVVLGATARADVFDHARDDDSMSEEASRLFDEGREAAKREDYPAACALFARSLRIESALGTQLNYADCLEHTSQLRRAYEQFVEVYTLARERAQLERQQFAAGRILALKSRLATIIIDVEDPTARGLVILVDNHKVQVRSRITELADPAEIEVIASTIDGRHTQKVDLFGGRTTTVKIPRIVKAEPVVHVTETNLARAELAFGSLASGVHVGLRVCQELDCSNRVSLPLVASVSLFAASILATDDKLQPAQAQLYNSTQFWAIWNSVFIVDEVEADWGYRTEASFGLGAHATGFASGLVLWRLWHPSAGDVALTNSFFLWGTVLTYFSYNFTGDRKEWQPAVLAGDGALLAGALLSTQVEVSRGKLFLIDVAGAVGLGLGGVITDAVDHQQDDHVVVGAGFAGGAVLGLGIASLVAWRTGRVPSPQAVTLTPIHNGVALSGSF